MAAQAKFANHIAKGFDDRGRYLLHIDIEALVRIGFKKLMQRGYSVTFAAVWEAFSFVIRPTVTSIQFFELFDAEILHISLAICIEA